MSEQMTDAPPIVLVHGLWMTARSWDRWVEYYRAKGYEGHVAVRGGSACRLGFAAARRAWR
jgi:pimeloyl-ACP methyl ester carboxylesterase